MEKLKTHYLKILPEYFDEVVRRIKTAEVRYNDRGFSKGDLLVLEEWTGKEYTGYAVVRRITAVYDLAKIGCENYVLLCMK